MILAFDGCEIGKRTTATRWQVAGLGETPEKSDERLIFAADRQNRDASLAVH